MLWALIEEIATRAVKMAGEKEVACCVRGYRVYKDIWAAAIRHVLVCCHRKIFVVKLYLRKIFPYIFCVRKYFYNEKKVNYGSWKFFVKSLERWSLFQSALCRWHCFVSSKTLSQFQVGRSTQGVRPVTIKWCNYDMTRKLTWSLIGTHIMRRYREVKACLVIHDWLMSGSSLEGKALLRSDKLNCKAFYLGNTEPWSLMPTSGQVAK